MQYALGTRCCCASSTGHWIGSGIEELVSSVRAKCSGTGHWGGWVLALRTWSAHSQGTGDGKLPLLPVILAPKPNQMPYKVYFTLNLLLLYFSLSLLYCCP